MSRVRGGPDHHPGRAGLDRLPDRLDRSQSAADLESHIDVGADPADVIEVHGVAAARAVEVDDVQLARARIYPPPRGVERVGVVDGLLIELALGQAHGLALEDVDGGEQDHARAPATPAQIATNPSSMRSPFSDDFSGWN